MFWMYVLVEHSRTMMLAYLTSTECAQLALVYTVRISGQEGEHSRNTCMPFFLFVCANIIKYALRMWVVLLNVSFQIWTLMPVFHLSTGPRHLVHENAMLKRQTTQIQTNTCRCNSISIMYKSHHKCFGWYTYLPTTEKFSPFYRLRFLKLHRIYI